MQLSAIHQAIRLSKYPTEMSWVCQSDTPLPDGITELLRLTSSSDHVEQFAEKNHTDPIALQKLLINFIDNVLLTKNNSDSKLLGLTANADTELFKLHYQLLIKIYHPDKNTSPDAVYQTSKITKAYQSMKDQQPASEYKNIRISRAHPKSFYTATSKAEQQISTVKSTLIAVLTTTVISVILIGGYLYEPSKQELFAQKINDGFSVTKISNDEQKTLPANEGEGVNHFSMAKYADASDLELLQTLLSSIEVAYEKGDANKIQTLLNSPEIKEQSDKDVFEKLKQLFQITSKRKMVLYNFEWKNIAGQISGKGKFLSRYHLNDQKQWLTREGVASIIASKTDKLLFIKSLKLDNKIIDQ